MAVEIPVVVNIDKAFQDAAKRVGIAIEPLRKSIEGLTEDMETWTSIMRGADIKSDDWLIAAKNIQAISEQLAQADYQLRRYTSNEGSIKQMSIDLAELNRRWEAMGASQKFGPDGKTLSADAQKAVTQYKQITAELNRQGKTLQQIIAEETRLEKLRQKGIQSRRYENAILNTTAKTMRVLQEQERILSDRLSRATIGSNKYNKLKVELEGVRRELSAINGEAIHTESRMERLVKNSIRLVALHAAGTFIRNVREVTAEFELQRVALGSIIQDTERAEGLFRKIKAAAIESPFEIKDLVSYTKQLSAYQIETDKLFDTTMKLADVSAGLGVDMGRLILAYGQVRAAAVLRGQELRQFTEAGIPLVDKLAEKFTELRGEMVSTGEVFQLISERAVPFRMIEEIFNDMTSAGGMFYKMQEKQAKTLAGQWANLKDSVSIMYDEIGNTSVVHKAMESMISGARSVMQNWRSWYNVINVVGTGLAAYLGIAKSVAAITNLMAAAEKKAALAESVREKGMRKFVTSLVGKTAAEKISKVATDLHTAAMIRAMLATNGLSRAFWQLTAAMATNPFGITIALVGSLVALFSTLSDKTRDISKDIDNAEASIKAFNKTTKDTAKLIDEYEELAKKENLTAKEAAKLRDVSRELGSIFPKTTEGINKQTGALTLNIEKLKEYNKEAEKAIRKGMEAEIRENEKTIRKNQKEIDRLVRENTRGWGRNKTLGLLSPILFPISDAKMSENTEAMIKLQDDNEKLQKTNVELQNTLDGVTDSTNSASAATTKWQDKLIEFNSRIDKEGKTINVVSPDQIKNYSKLSDALDDIAKKYKEYDEQEKAIKASIKGKTGAEKEELQGILDRTTARKNLAKEELDYYNAFYLTQKNKKGRDDRLQKLRNEISDITNAYKKFIELRKYKSEAAALSDIGTFFPGLKGWKPTYENMLKKLESMLSSYSGDADATRLLQQAIANIKFDDVKRDLDVQLKKLSEEIKRSEAARNFYQSILGLTGDEDLATQMTVSVYGQPGEDFKDRVQRELYQALNSIDPSMIDKGLLAQLIGDTTTLDFDDLYKNLDAIPDEVQAVIKRLRAEVEKYNEDIAMGLVKSLEKAQTYAQKQEEIAKQSAKRISEINALSVPQETKDNLLKQNAQKVAEDTARLQYEAFKDSPMYVEMFSRLDTASTRMLQSMRENIVALKAQWKDLDPRNLKEMQSRLNQIDQQLAAKNPFKALIDSIKEYRSLTKQTSRREADDTAVSATNYAEEQKRLLEVAKQNYQIAVQQHGIKSSIAIAARDEMEVQSQTTDDAIKNAEAAQDTANAYHDTAKRISAAADEMQKWTGYVTDSLSGVGEIVETFASEDFAETFNIISEGLGKTMQGATGIASSIGRLATGDLTAIPSLIQGIGDVISGIFGSVNKIRIKELNKKIEVQKRLIEDLEYEYGRLEKAIADSFGTDYIANYNKQLEALRAKEAAYREQARLENEKGKKKDEEKIREYNKSATETADSINDLNGQLSKFFTGTDLTSAAKDFAEAWIEAYKEFGSTTAAMKEKFNDMIESMVVNSLAAQLIQGILKPVFDQIDEAASDGALTAHEIGLISAQLPERMQMINDAMTGMVNELGAAGINLRQQAGQFTGIARNIAGASEESITGLAAGINTQNFYMQHIDMNVALILSYLTGGTTTAAASVTGQTPDPYKEQMLLYAAHIPAIDQNLADLLVEVRKVIKPKGTTSTHYVATNL